MSQPHDPAMSNGMSPNSTATSSSTPSSFNYSSHDIESIAIEEIKSMLKSSDQLIHLSSLESQSTKHLNSLEEQLRVYTEEQLTSIIKGIELLCYSQEKLQSLRYNLCDMYHHCISTSTLFNIDDLIFIEYLNTVKTNLDATLSLISKFSTLPKQCSELLDLMNDDHMIKEVYKRLRKLCILRDNAFKQHQKNLSSAASSTTSSSSTSSYVQSYNTNTLLQQNDVDFLSQLEQKFSVLQEVSNAIEERIMENIEDSAYEGSIAVDDPCTLIRSIEVIEMEDSAIRKVLGENAVHLGSELVKQKTYKSMKVKMFDVLERTIAKRFTDLHKFEDEKEKDTAVTINLNSSQPPPPSSTASHSKDNESPTNALKQSRIQSTLVKRSEYLISVLSDLSVYVDELIKLISETEVCYPPDYHIANFFEARYRHWILFTLQYHTTDTTQLSKKALLRATQWIQRYEQQLLDFTYNENENKQLSKIMKTCMLEYTRSTEATLRTLVTNICKNDETSDGNLNTIEKDADDYYITNGPSDLFYTLSQQIDIVCNTYQLENDALSYVVLMIADVVTYYQNLILKFITTVNRREDVENNSNDTSRSNRQNTNESANDLLFGENHVPKDDTYFCAVINNSYQCIENLEEIKERCMERFTDLPPTANKATMKSPDITSNSVNDKRNGAAASYNKAEGSKSSNKSQVSLYAKMQDTFDECSDGFVSVATEATDILVLIIVTTCQPTLQNILSERWVSSSSYTHDLVTTINDYMNDYKQWIRHQAYYLKLLKSLLHTIVAEYIRRMLTLKWTCDRKFLLRYQEDIDILYDTFSRYEILPKKHIDDELSILSLIYDILSSESDFIAMHFTKVLSRFGDLSYDIIDVCLNARSDISRSMRKQLIEQMHEVQRMEEEAANERGSTAGSRIMNNPLFNAISIGSDAVFSQMNAAKSVFERFIAKHANRNKDKLKVKTTRKIEKKFVHDDEQVMKLDAFLSPSISAASTYERSPRSTTK